jgi:quercetin dioxygenase-like cupin family protein
MATNGTNSQSIQKLELPPGRPSEPYILHSLCGEIIYIPCSRSATRLLVTGKESDDAFAVVGSGGSHSPPIGFHYHNDAHDVFLCIKGTVNVWAGDQARTMSPGDFASVPPKVVHQYQILGTHTEFLGLIVPGGWEEFFRFIGEPYAGPLFPLSDDRNPFEVLIPKLKMAAEKFDMVPLPRHPQFEPQPWKDDDNSLPGALEPYFLKKGSGPAYLLGGAVVRPLAGMKESGGRFTVSSIEGSSFHKDASIFGGPSKGLVFESTHHCFQVSDGSVAVTLDGAETTLNVGETVYIPQGTRFKLEFVSRFAQVYVFTNGVGLSEVMIEAGEKYSGETPPEKAKASDGKVLEGLGSQFGFRPA